MKIGYARVSTADQHLRMQEDALKSAGCEEIFTDVISGAKAERPGLEKASAYLRENDTLVVWKLDRLGRSIQHLIQTVKTLQERKIGLQSLRESLDTSTSGGKLIFHMFSALAEFERDLIQERTQAGLKAARARGRMGGRPPLLDNRQINRMVELYDEGKSTVAEICKIYDVSRPSFYNHLREDAELARIMQEREWLSSGKEEKKLPFSRRRTKEEENTAVTSSERWKKSKTESFAEAYQQSGFLSPRTGSNPQSPESSSNNEDSSIQGEHEQSTNTTKLSGGKRL